MERTISAMIGKGSVNHNTRAFTAKNVDKNRSADNVEFCQEDIKQVYHKLFDEARERYNAKQKRKDRMIDNYYEKIRRGKQEKLFHEVIFQIGNKDDMNAKSEDGLLAKRILTEFMDEFQARNPYLYVFSAHLHMDEETPHLHIDFVPYITESKRGLDIRVKAKGLLSQMLSLPEDWDYTLAGLSYINREKIDAIREAVRELERAGYIQRSRERDEKGRLRGTDYIIYEQPPNLDLPTLENPTLENPTQEKPTLENPMQLNKDIQKTDLPKKEKSNTDLSSNHSIPILSPNPSPLREETAEPERKGTEAADAYSVYEEIIKDNIEYEHFIKHTNIDRERLDEIVSLILETVCTKRKTIRIAGDDYPAELVKAKFMKLNSSHIEFVFDCMKENTTKIRNIKQYLKAVLFNAPNTIDSYYTALVNHDMYGGY